MRLDRPGSGEQALLLTQPRPLAVLVYLALARPRGFQSRDSLIALLWPEADQARGRHALRNALHAIRQALGDDAILSAGDGLVALNRAVVSCDALELESALRADGQLLQGFFVSDAPEFERWLDGERRRLRQELLAEARAELSACESQGDCAGTMDVLRRIIALAPDDDAVVRRLMEALAATGDRAGALRVYDEFAARIRAEYGIEPSDAAVAQATAIRACHRQIVASIPAPRLTSPAAVAPADRHPAPLRRRRDRLAPALLAGVLVLGAGLLLSVRRRKAT